MNIVECLMEKGFTHIIVVPDNDSYLFMPCESIDVARSEIDERGNWNGIEKFTISRFNRKFKCTEFGLCIAR